MNVSDEMYAKIIRLRTEDYVLTVPNFLAYMYGKPKNGSFIKMKSLADSYCIPVLSKDAIFFPNKQLDINYYYTMHNNARSVYFKVCEGVSQTMDIMNTLGIETNKVIYHLNQLLDNNLIFLDGSDWRLNRHTSRVINAIEKIKLEDSDVPIEL